MDILTIIEMITKKKEEVDNEIKNRINTEGTHENKKTESSSNHNSNNLKDISNDNGFMKNANKSSNDIGLSKSVKNKNAIIPKQKIESKKEEELNKNDKDKINIIMNKINDNKNESKKVLIQRKKTFLGNVSHSLKVGIKGVFNREKSGKKKK